MGHRKPMHFIVLISAALLLAACQATALGPADGPRSYSTLSEP